MSSINTFAISGVAREHATPVGQGSYLKVILDCYNKKADRTDPVEVLGRSEDFREIRKGDLVAMQGSIGGRINDRGYCNLSLFAMNIEIAGAKEPMTAQAEDEDEDEDEDPPF